MSAFTVLGLLVFWCWCFELGVALGHALDIAPAIGRVILAERRVRKDLDAFVAFHVALADKGWK